VRIKAIIQTATAARSAPPRGRAVDAETDRLHAKEKRLAGNQRTFAGSRITHRVLKDANHLARCAGPSAEERESSREPNGDSFFPP
jgi:hypothetical protein